MYYNRIQLVTLDGQSQVNLYRVTYPGALDFDFRYVLGDVLNVQFKCKFTFRQDYIFWVDYARDRIMRATGVETTSSSTITDMVTTGISCAGKQPQNNGYFNYCM